jgi:hypothetical protein
MVTNTHKAALATLALGCSLITLDAQDAARASALPAAPNDPVSAPPAVSAAPDPAATLRFAIIRGKDVEAVLHCRHSGTVALVGPDGNRGRAKRFRCRSGSARVHLGQRPRGEASIAIMAGGGELRMFLSRSRAHKPLVGRGKPRALASTYDPTVLTSCYGRSTSQGGGGSVSFNIQQYSRFGQPYYSTIYWRPWLHWAQRSTGQSGYYTDQPTQHYVSYPNTFGDGGRYVDTTPGATIFNVGGGTAPGQSNTTPVTMNYPGMNVLPLIETWINGVHESAWFPTTTVSGSAGWYNGWCKFN